MSNVRLVEAVKQYALKYGEFTLSSGKKSSYFLDISQVTNRSDCLELITNRIIRHLPDPHIDAVGGPELGAAPLVGGLLVRAGMGLEKLHGFLVRKKPKNGELIEGILHPGDNVLILEDVATTGQEAKRACEVVESLGGTVRLVIAVLDRLEGASETLANWDYRSLLTIKDLGL